MKLRHARNLRRAQRKLPGAHQCSIDGDGEVDVGLTHVGVIEKIVDACLEGIDVPNPAFEGNGDAELMLLVAFRRRQRHKRVLALLAGYVVEKSTGHGLNRRGLEEVSVETAEDPVQPWNLKRGAEARIGCGFCEPTVVVSDAHAADQCSVSRDVQRVREMIFNQACAGVRRGFRHAVGREALIVDDEAEQIVLCLVEGVDAA